MFKSLIAGFLLGIAGTVAAVYYIPAVDQARESSIITVNPNGGNTEAFHINIPMDRIMVGAPGQPEPLPQGLEWPLHESLDGVRAELFKVRNARDAVVGVASRMTMSGERGGDSIEWVLHLPARGSMYVTMPARAVDGVHRVGTLLSGTDEFLPLSGRMTERWFANESDDEDAPDGRIELVTMFVGELGPEPIAPAVEEQS